MTNVIVNYPCYIPSVTNYPIPFFLMSVNYWWQWYPFMDNHIYLMMLLSQVFVNYLISNDWLYCWQTYWSNLKYWFIILIHLADVANLAMVTKVVITHIYPFCYQLSYIPVLPEQLLDYVEAPLSFFVDVSSWCGMKKAN